MHYNQILNQQQNNILFKTMINIFLISHSIKRKQTDNEALHVNEGRSGAGSLWNKR